MQGSTGNFILTGSTGFSARLSWSEEYDIETNSSTVAVTALEILKGSGCYGAFTWIDGSIRIGSATAVEFSSFRGTHKVSTADGWRPVTPMGNHPAAPWSVENIAHEPDGTRSVTIAISIKGYTTVSGGGNGWTVNGSETVALAAIPRASAVAVASGSIGTALTVDIARITPGTTHTLTYTLGAASGTIAERTAETLLSWTPPLSLCAEITDAESAACTVTCQTYVGGVLTGSSTAAPTLSVPASVTLSAADGWAAVTCDNAGTAAEGIAAFVQGYSRAAVTFDQSKISSAGNYGALPASYGLILGAETVTQAPYRTAPITASGTMTATAFVTDTRGRTLTAQTELTVHPYAMPTLSAVTLVRCLADGTVDDEGTNILAEATATVSTLGGLNTAQLKAQWRALGGSYNAGETLSSGTAQVVGGGLIDNTGTYEARIVLTDALGNTASCEATVPTAAVAFHIREGGRSAAFGKYSETANALELASGWSLVLGSTSLSEAQLAALIALL